MTKTPEQNTPVPESVSRRNFLKLGSAGFLGMSAAEQAALRGDPLPSSSAAIDSCLFLLLTGGPSQLETFDPKPDAPAEIRGPFQSIQTSVPGIQLSETLPELAQRAHRFSIIRSLHHTAAPIHETGLQLIQTGRSVSAGTKYPAAGAVIAAKLGARGDVPPYYVLPRLLGNTGIRAYQGQTAGALGEAHDPIELNAHESPFPEMDTHSYGSSSFAQNCQMARRLVEHGVRFVTVNMFDSLDQHPTWDCHGSGKNAGTTFADYRETVCPDFDHTLAALLDDLEESGLLKRTLVVALGEFGRTPKINRDGGRDHWPGVWSALIAGGTIPGGQIIGGSDAIAAAPIERPLAPAHLLATIHEAMGIDHQSKLTGQDGQEWTISEQPSIPELGTVRK